MTITTTASVSSTIDVPNKFNTLITQALDGTSAYIRAKETIEDLVSSGALDDASKAEVISGLLANITSSLTGTSMNAALEWAKYEKEVELRKLKDDIELGILDKEDLFKQAQIDKLRLDSRLAKVESKRMYGTSTFVGEDLVSLVDEGKVWEDMQLVGEQTDKVIEETKLVQQKTNESYAAIHKIVADTYTNFGNFTYTGLGATGLPTITRNDAGHTSLSDTQQDIAIEQAKGYSYNAWANALTGSSSILGTAMASGDLDVNSGVGKYLMDAAIGAARNLQEASTLADEADPSTNPNT